MRSSSSQQQADRAAAKEESATNEKLMVSLEKTPMVLFFSNLSLIKRSFPFFWLTQRSKHILRGWAAGELREALGEDHFSQFFSLHPGGASHPPHEAGGEESRLQSGGRESRRKGRGHFFHLMVMTRLFGHDFCFASWVDHHRTPFVTTDLECREFPCSPPLRKPFLSSLANHRLGKLPPGIAALPVQWTTRMRTAFLHKCPWRSNIQRVTTQVIAQDRPQWSFARSFRRETRQPWPGQVLGQLPPELEVPNSWKSARDPLFSVSSCQERICSFNLCFWP